MRNQTLCFIFLIKHWITGTAFTIFTNYLRLQIIRNHFCNLKTAFFFLKNYFLFTKPLVSVYTFTTAFIHFACLSCIRFIRLTPILNSRIFNILAPYLSSNFCKLASLSSFNLAFNSVSALISASRSACHSFYCRSRSYCLRFLYASSKANSWASSLSSSSCFYVSISASAAKRSDSCFSILAYSEFYKANNRSLSFSSASLRNRCSSARLLAS